MSNNKKISNATPTREFREWLESGGQSSLVNDCAVFRISPITSHDWMAPVQVIYVKRLYGSHIEDAAFDLNSAFCYAGLYNPRDGRLLWETSRRDGLVELDESFDISVWSQFDHVCVDIVSETVLGEDSKQSACPYASWVVRPTEQAVLEHYIETKSFGYPIPYGDHSFSGRSFSDPSPSGTLAIFSDWDRAVERAVAMWMSAHAERIEAIREAYRDWMAFVDDNAEDIRRALKLNIELAEALDALPSRAKNVKVVFKGEEGFAEVSEEMSRLSFALRRPDDRNSGIPISYQNEKALERAGVMKGHYPDMSLFVGVKYGGKWIYKPE